MLSSLVGLGCSGSQGANDAATDSAAADTATPLDTTPADTAPRDTAAPPDTRPDAADAAADSATGDGAAADAGAGCMLTRALVTTSDFMVGGYALGTISPPALMAVGTMAPDQDHVPVSSGCLVFNLLHGNDELAVLDPAMLPRALRRIPLRGMTAGDAGAMPYQANPYDVLVLAPTRAYVSLYNAPRVAIVDPTRDGASAVTGMIDLAPVRAMSDRDASGALEATRLISAGGRVFLALQNLNAFAPVTAGSLAVIDPASNALVDAAPTVGGTQPVILGGRNPMALTLTPNGRTLVVAHAGQVAFMAPQMLDGGIETVDAVTLSASGIVITEMALGGDLGAVVMLTDTRGWAQVTTLTSDAGPGSHRVVEFDLATRMVGRTVLTTGSIAGLERDPSGNVWVLDRTASRSGVRVLRPDGTELTTGPLGTGPQPPYGLAFVP
ncbi:MAG: hypothetical protein HY909_25345 [Deltaproteobacteria bacterium]|nr:hypothetical protein [Deltaproteobacteria bacterium]